MQSTVVLVYINSIKATLYFNFGFYQGFKQLTHKHGNKEDLSINSFSLFTCKLLKVRYQNLILNIVSIVLK